MKKETSSLRTVQGRHSRRSREDLDVPVWLSREPQSVVLRRNFPAEETDMDSPEAEKNSLSHERRTDIQKPKGEARVRGAMGCRPARVPPEGRAHVACLVRPRVPAA